MLHEAVDWIEGQNIKVKTVGCRMLIVLMARVLQLGSAVQSISESGHAGEAAPTARAMISACIALVYIAEDPEPRTAAYMETDRIVRKKRIADLSQEQKKAAAAGVDFLLSADDIADIDRHDAELTSLEDQKFALLAKHGATPQRLGARTDTFSGLNERDLFERMNALHWYLTYYKLFSDEIHVSANALSAELVEHLAGQSLIGAKYEDPFHVLLASRDMVMNGLEQIDRVFGLNHREQLAAIDAPIRDALAKFAASRKSAADRASSGSKTS